MPSREPCRHAAQAMISTAGMPARMVSRYDSGASASMPGSTCNSGIVTVHDSASSTSSARPTQRGARGTSVATKKYQVTSSALTELTVIQPNHAEGIVSGSSPM